MTQQHAVPKVLLSCYCINVIRSDVVDIPHKTMRIMKNGMHSSNSYVGDCLLLGFGLRMVLLNLLHAHLLSRPSRDRLREKHFWKLCFLETKRLLSQSSHKYLLKETFHEIKIELKQASASQQNFY